MFGRRPPPYALRQTVAPVEEPVSLADAKAWLRVDATFTDDDAKISGLITAARIEGERLAGKRFCVQSYVMTLDRFPPPRPLHGSHYGDGGASGPDCDRDWGMLGVGPHWPAIRIPGGAASVTSVSYYDTTETLQTLDPSTYQFSADYRPALLVVRFPPVTYPRPDAVQIAYTAGVAASAVGQNVKVALMMAVAQWYRNAGDVANPDPTSPETMPRASVGILLGEWDGELSAGR